MRSLPAVKVQTEFCSFNGGLDLVTPPLSIPPGFVRKAQNYEQAINGGYSRIVGYERYDGRPSPSDATYAVLTCTITGTVNVGDVLTDNSGANFGTVISLPAGQAILTKVTGTFATGNIKVGSTVVGTCTGPQITDGASTALLAAQYNNLAADQYRSDIGVVPGSGSVLGVWVYNDVRYAFRNNAGGTAAVMFKATTSGWTSIALGRTLAFKSGSAAVSEGQTLTGATSGASGVVTRISLESGSYGSSTAAGHFIFATITGSFQNGENLQVGGVTKAVSNGVDAAITLQPNGKFEFVNANFGGSVNTLRMYGCDGVNQAFEFDGTVFVPITTGMSPDAPSHIAAHKNQLFLSFVGSVQNSSLGAPYQWSPVTGASEIAMGDTVTGFMVQPGGATEGALAIFTKGNISILYGSSVSDWKLIPFNQQAGAIAGTIQRIGTTMMLGYLGITNLTTTQAYGNFASATLSKRVQTFLQDKHGLASGSCIVRNKTQYRVFFSDGSALFVTLDNGQSSITPSPGQAPIAPGQVLGIMPQLFPDPVKCICSAQLADGTEVIYFGSTNGYVFQMEKGTSFDGANIEAYLYLVFNPSGNARVLKQYRHAVFEVSGNAYAEFNASYQLGYNTTNIDQPGNVTLVQGFSPVFWDSFTWDQFQWDGVALTPSELDMTGSAENMGVVILSNSDYFASSTLSGVTFHYTPRRILR